MNLKHVAICFAFLVVGERSHASDFWTFLEKLGGWQHYEDAGVKIKKEKPKLRNLDELPPEVAEKIREWNEPYQPHYYRIEVRRPQGFLRNGEERHCYFMRVFTLGDIAILRALAEKDLAMGDEVKFGPNGSSYLIRGMGNWRYYWDFDKKQRFISLVYDHEIEWLLQKLETFED